MKKLDVWIEIEGRQIYAGTIEGTDGTDACFCYGDSYLRQENARAVSVSLPVRPESFTAEQTRNFFEGLLPEGFTRRTVAQWLHVDETDYLSILEGLGNECLGAIRITSDRQLELHTSYEQISPQKIRELAEEGAVKSTELLVKTHLSLTGASGKVGLYYEPQAEQWYMPMGLAPSTHILKQSHVRLDSIVTNEQLSLLTALKLGIDVPDSFIVKAEEETEELSGESEASVLLATARYDRIFPKKKKMIGGLPVPLRLHQEDFAQALGISAADKYETEDKGETNGYLRRMFDLLRMYSADPITDQTRLWNIIVFNALLGNTDSHIKNFSLLYHADLGAMRLAPAYDLLSTSVYESSTRDLAFRIGDAWSLDQLTRDCFEQAAEEAGLGRKFAMKQLDKICNRFEAALHEAGNYLEMQGFYAAGRIAERILKTGGVRQLR